MTEFQHPGFTIIGDHLAQHRELSLTAIGLATYIQSLPEGAPVDIRTLAEKFPEGRERVATALRELEAYGYIERVRERTDNGKLVTVTYSYNNPEATRARRAREAAARSPHRTTGAPTPEEPAPARPTTAEATPDAMVEATTDAMVEATPEPAPGPAPEHAPEPVPAYEPTPGPVPEPVPEPVPAHEPAPVRRAEPAPVRTADLDTDPAPRRVPSGPRPPLPRPRTSEHRQAAAALLAELRRADPRLLLSVRDVHRLAPAVAAWLERGADPDAVRHTLTTGLPAPLRHPAALLAHRLTALLPPRLPDAPAAPATGHPHPFQTCDTCDRAFRAPTPGHCRDCRRQGATAEPVAA
ncbi:hypothetical protein ACH4FE_24185 [Streptomyces celluloflavus]|uniref:hypothetical protein n=1 Tax=Streptomyces celluloflavus TaxID=58344 RepID=UPI00379EA237